MYCVQANIEENIVSEQKITLLHEEQLVTR